MSRLCNNRFKRVAHFCRNATGDGGVMLKAIRLFFDSQAVGSLLIFAGSIIFSSFVISGLYLDMAFVEGIAGFWGSVVACALFPLTHIVVPWYALLAYGSWTLIIVCYGGVMIGALVIAVGMSVKDLGLRRGSGLAVSSPDDKSHCASGETCRESLEGFI